MLGSDTILFLALEFIGSEYMIYILIRKNSTPILCLLFLSLFANHLSHAKLLQLCLTLCDPMDCSPSGPSIHGILQARILEWVAVPFSRGSFRPRDQTCISLYPAFGRQVLYH